MFETPESIERLKEQDRIKREREDDYSQYEVVEESGDVPAPKKQRADDGETRDDTEANVDYDEDEDDEDIDPEDMADDERLMLEGRRAMGWVDADEDDGWEEYD